jgi:uncharacterized protein DUF3768
MNESGDVTREIEPCPNGGHRAERRANTRKAASMFAGPKYRAATERNSERGLNDALRQTFTGGRVLISPGVHSLPPDDNAKVLERVRGFTAFIDDNVPHHDFGSFELAGVVYCFELEGFSSAQDGSKEPAGAGKATRVLTIMRADEY